MEQQGALRAVVLSAVDGTSQAMRNERFRLFAQATLPVFETPETLGIAEGVAVVYRDGEGNPIHGGFFSVTPSQEVVKLILVDEANAINTDENPAWTAFGLCCSLGDLTVRDGGVDRTFPWTIVDLSSAKPGEDLRLSTPVRQRVRDAYLAKVAPFINQTH